MTAAMRDSSSLLAHPILRKLADALRERPGALAADDGAPRRAAVAVVLRTSADVGVELLLIKRSEHEGDPWSGQVALPGGRHEADDATLQDTAVRETREETAIDIATSGVVLGTLDELRPRTPVLPPIIVTPYVAVVRPDVTVSPSEEVALAFWGPLSLFAEPGVAAESTVLARGIERRVSSYLIGAHVVWGMTERILSQLLELVASPHL